MGETWQRALLGFTCPCTTTIQSLIPIQGKVEVIEGSRTGDGGIRHSPVGQAAFGAGCAWGTTIETREQCLQAPKMQEAATCCM
jgi:hypothetical protein